MRALIAAQKTQNEERKAELDEQRREGEEEGPEGEEEMSKLETEETFTKKRYKDWPSLKRLRKRLATYIDSRCHPFAIQFTDTFA